MFSMISMHLLSTWTRWKNGLLCKVYCANVKTLTGYTKTKTVVFTKDHNIFLISGVRKRLFSSIAGYVLIEA